ncbi:MAG: hypothetical protein ACRD2X_06520 [Vicinamibacteraceae bacterium]
MKELQRLLAEHLAAPFPTNVEKGIDYGTVDPVMIDADIDGWASKVSKGEVLTSADRDRLRVARNDLAQSLASFPEAARPYYETHRHGHGSTRLAVVTATRARRTCRSASNARRRAGVIATADAWCIARRYLMLRRRSVRQRVLGS